MQGSGILGTTAGEEVGLSGLPDRSTVVQLLDFGQSSCPFLALACAAATAAAAAACSSSLSSGDLFLVHKLVRPV